MNQTISSVAPRWVIFVVLAVCVFAVMPLAAADQSGEIEAQGLSLIKAGRTQDAVAVFERGVALYPKNPSLLNALGAALTLRGEDGKAQQCFRQALSADPSFMPARKNLAISYFESRKYDLAERELQPLADNASTKALADFFLGLIAEQRKQYREAIELLTAAGPLARSEPEGELALAQSYYEMQERQQTGAALDQFAGFANASALDHFHAGLINCQLGRYPQAITEFDRAKAGSPRLIGVEYYEAFALAKQNNLSAAQQVLQKLVTDNAQAGFLGNATSFAKDSGNYEVALQAIRYACALQPSREQNYLDFSTLCMNSRNYVVALQVVNAGLSRIGPSYRLLAQKGALLDKLTREDDAQQAFRAAMSLQKDNSVALLGLAICQEHAREFGPAVHTLEAAVQRFPSNPKMHYYLGLAYEGLSRMAGTSPADMAKANLSLHDAIRLDSSFGDAYCALARISLPGNSSRAMELFRQCLDRKPHDYYAEYELGRLYLQTRERAQGQRLLDLSTKDRNKDNQAEEQVPRVDAAGSAFGSLSAPD